MAVRGALSRRRTAERKSLIVELKPTVAHCGNVHPTKIDYHYLQLRSSFLESFSCGLQQRIALSSLRLRRFWLHSVQKKINLRLPLISTSRPHYETRSETLAHTQFLGSANSKVVSIFLFKERKHFAEELEVVIHQQPELLPWKLKSACQSAPYSLLTLLWL